MTKIEQLDSAMVSYNHGNTARINHAHAVHNYAKIIATQEEISKKEMFILENAAILHDIGMKVCEEKYNSTSGKLQEKEGPIVSKIILEDLNYENIDRILFLIGHHHSYNDISGIDYQILIEADLIVNFKEENTPKKTIKKLYESIFKTKTGKQLCEDIFKI